MSAETVGQAVEQVAAAPKTTTVADEVMAMRIACDALARLDAPAQDRAMYWLNQRLRWSRPADDQDPF